MEWLYHYGVKGMRWGVKRSRNKNKTRSKTKGKSRKKVLDKNEEQLESIARTRRLVAGSKLASEALMSIAQKTYNKYKDNGTPGQAAIVTGSARASQVLDLIGDVATTSLINQQYQYVVNYWRN